MKTKKFLIFAVSIYHVGNIFTMQQKQGAQISVGPIRRLERLAAARLVDTGNIPQEETTPHKIRDIIAHERSLRTALDAHDNNPTNTLLAYLRIIQAQQLINSDLIQNLLACEMKRNAHQPIETALQRLAGEGNNLLINILLDHGADIEARDNNDFTSLHYAVSRGHQATVAFLLDHGANIEAQNNIGLTPLHYAASKGHQATVAFLLDRGANIEAQDNIESTPLHYAASNGHQATVALLLDRGANIEARDNIGFTSLHYAASKGQQTTVAFLIDRGANIEAQGNQGHTPLHYAAAKGHQAT